VFEKLSLHKTLASFCCRARHVLPTCVCWRKSLLDTRPAVNLELVMLS